MQVFLATHDYVLTSDLSRAIETNADWRPGTVFFALGRRDGQEGVAVERGELLADLQDNAILEAFASLHERERAAFDSAGGPLKTFDEENLRFHFGVENLAGAGQR